MTADLYKKKKSNNQSGADGSVQGVQRSAIGWSHDDSDEFSGLPNLHQL